MFKVMNQKRSVVLKRTVMYTLGRKGLDKHKPLL